MPKKSDYKRTVEVFQHMVKTGVTLSMIERGYFLDSYGFDGFDLLVPRAEAFDALADKFEGAYNNPDASWWQNTSDQMRDKLDDLGMLGERPNDNEERYAMHFGCAYRSLKEEELEALSKAVRRFGGSAYQDGDNAFEWGERYDVDPAMRESLNDDQWLRYQSAHFMVYINKGIDPRVVWDAVKEALPLVAFLPVEAQWAYNGNLPFSVDEAEVWGENVNTAHRIGTHSSDWACRQNPSKPTCPCC